jgi:hypothetical protein
MKVRVTWLSYFDGLPEPLIGAPGACIQGGIAGGSAALAGAAATVARPLAPSSASPCVSKRRRSMRPLSATGSLGNNSCVSRLPSAMVFLLLCLGKTRVGFAVVYTTCRLRNMVHER